MRTFCKNAGRKNIPIQAIGLSLYEELGEAGVTEEKLGKEVIRTQWLDFSTLGSRSLLGRRILIVVSATSIQSSARQAKSCRHSG